MLFAKIYLGLAGSSSSLTTQGNLRPYRNTPLRHSSQNEPHAQCARDICWSLSATAPLQSAEICLENQRYITIYSQITTILQHFWVPIWNKKVKSSPDEARKMPFSGLLFVCLPFSPKRVFMADKQFFSQIYSHRIPSKLSINMACFCNAFLFFGKYIYRI